MFLTEASKLTVISPKKSNLVDTQDKDFKIAMMFKDLKGNMNKCFNETQEYETEI